MFGLTDEQKAEIEHELSKLSELERRKKTVEINETDLASWKEALPRMGQALAIECQLLINHVSEQTKLIKNIIQAFESNNNEKIETANATYLTWNLATRQEFPIERIVAFADYFDCEWET
jgi:hypothetical protein